MSFRLHVDGLYIAFIYKHYNFCICFSLILSDYKDNLQ